MSTHTEGHYHDYFAGSFDGSFLPAIMAAAVVVALAGIAGTNRFDTL